MKTYYVWDGDVEVAFVSLDSETAAGLFVQTGNFEPSLKTQWFELTTYEKKKGGKIVNEEGHLITVHPEEPSCCEDNYHNWQRPHKIVGGIKENPGVWGNAGGVIINDCCMCCGCKREKNTWDYKPDDGQIVTSITYVPKFYADLIERNDN